ncbi:MAG TPA: CbtA family protein [Methylocystis sp.]|nr:CbtA family protein [Methylocystis sp.]
MTGQLLFRGMLIGLLAGLLSFAFLKLAGEPSVDSAIAYEGVVEAAKAKAKAEDAAAKGLPAPVEETEPELVSRDVQSGVGLLTAVTVYDSAFGGLFALVFALTYRRMGDFSPRATAALLALAGFVSVYVAPTIKYPPGPPSVGAPETIALRTSLYFAMILISLASMIAAGVLRSRLEPRLSGWNSALIAAAAYVIVVAGVALALPDVNEVPDGFPAADLWRFRLASLGGQAIMWAAFGVLFGVAAERLLAQRETSLYPQAS